MRQVIQELRETVDQAVQQAARIAIHDPTAMNSVEARVRELEAEYPIVRSRPYMTNRSADFFFERLGKNARYPRKRYEELIAKFFLLFEKPMMAAISLCVILDSGTDPAVLLEDALREAERNGAVFSTAIRGRGKERLFERALMWAGDEISTDQTQVLAREFDQLHRHAEAFRTARWKLDELMAAVENDVIKTLENRGLVKQAESWYQDTVALALSVSEDPEFTAAALLFSALRTPDPTEQFRHARKRAEEYLAGLT